jgi:K+-sensing histidine kinase KdpD
MNEESGQEQLSRENARLRGDLLTVVRRISHDLRTPLGGMSRARRVAHAVISRCRFGKKWAAAWFEINAVSRR